MKYPTRYREALAVAPAFGDRKTFSGVDCVWIPDPWAPLASFPCWCSIPELEKDGIKYPPPAPRAASADASSSSWRRQVAWGKWRRAEVSEATVNVAPASGDEDSRKAAFVEDLDPEWVHALETADYSHLPKLKKKGGMGSTFMNELLSVYRKAKAKQAR